jgi:hypothetical protein
MTEFKSKSDELQYRINACREGRPRNGYAMVHYLRNFINICKKRLEDIDTFLNATIDDLENEEEEIVQWYTEHKAEKEELEPLIAEAEAGLPENDGDLKGWLPQKWLKKHGFDKQRK